MARAETFRTSGIQSAEDVARIGVAALARGQRTIVPYFSGWFTSLLVRLLPVGFITLFVEKSARKAAYSA